MRNALPEAMAMRGVDEPERQRKTDDEADQHDEARLASDHHAGW